jgi:hypothetical protein
MGLKPLCQARKLGAYQEATQGFPQHGSATQPDFFSYPSDRDPYNDDPMRLSTEILSRFVGLFKMN